MRKYEIMYILDKDINNLEMLQNRLHEILENNGGKIEEREDWGVKEFSYLIKKKSNGFYSVLIVYTTVENINEFVRVSRIEKGVLRTIVINVENEKNYIQSTKFSKTELKNEKQEYNDRKFFINKRNNNRKIDKVDKVFEKK